MSFKISDSIRIIRGAPFLRLLIPFIIGILGFEYYPKISLLGCIVLVLFPIVALLIFNFLSDYHKLKYSVIRGILINWLFIIMAYLMAYLNQPSNSTSWYRHASNNYAFAIVKISSELESKEKSIKANVEIVSLMNQKESIAVHGNAIIYFKKQDSIMKLKYGDLIIVRNLFKEIKSNTNPGAFDYAKYCNRNLIYETAYLKSTDWKALKESRNSLMKYANNGSQWTRSILKKYIADSSSLGIAEALLVGYRKDMDNDLWQAYSNAGIVHIIAISGMHMALVFGGMRYLIFLIPFFKKRKRLALLICIIAMWIFACVTGLPPSVTRSAVMLTFIAFGDMLDRNMSIYNNLCLSAFILLCYQPNWLFDVGFQLSYLAVLSLVVFYNPIKNWFYFSNKILDLFWNFLAITIAAQILTLPLCIYYFHQIPLLFLGTNLIAVPLTTGIIYAEIVLIFFSWCEPIGFMLGKIISFFIHLLNYCVIEISQFSFAVYGDLQINFLQTLLMYCFLICCSIWLMKQKAKQFTLALLSLFLLVASFVFVRVETLHQNKLIVYQTPRNTCVEIVQGEQIYSMNHDSIYLNKNLEKYTFKPAHVFLNASTIHVDSNVGNESIQIKEINKQRVAKIGHFNFHFNEILKTDFLIIGGKQKPNLEWFQKNIQAKQIILDGSVPFWQFELYQIISEEINVPLHNTTESGAFVVNF